jgi:hypothetical protein
MSLKDFASKNSASSLTFHYQLGAMLLKLGQRVWPSVLKDFDSVRDNCVTGEYHNGRQIFRKRK